MVPEYPNGLWRCDGCSFEPKDGSPVHHCTPCGYDLCDKCYDLRANQRYEYYYYSSFCVNAYVYSMCILRTQESKKRIRV